MSGQFDSFHLSLGVISVAIVSLFTKDFLFQDQTKPLRERIGECFRILGYWLWLLIEIAKANMQVLFLALHPKLKERISPQIISFSTSLKKDFSRFVFAQSITLTPGTVTVQVNDGEFIVYALTKEMAQSLPGEMERRVKRVFEPERIPEGS